jgi:hypothetical protein
VAWFLIDKPGAAQSGFPEQSDNLLDNFQLAFNMVKAGYPDLAFIYIWKHHYIVLSLLCGALLAVATGTVSDWLGRRRMRQLVLPGAARKSRSSGGAGQPGPDSAPVDRHETSE